MRYEAMPHDRMERFRMRRHAIGIHGRDHDHAIADLLGVATIAPDYAEHLEAALLRLLERCHDIRADVLLQIATPDREHEYCIVLVRPARAQPSREHRVPA